MKKKRQYKDIISRISTLQLIQPDVPQEFTQEWKGEV